MPQSPCSNPLPRYEYSFVGLLSTILRDRIEPDIKSIEHVSIGSPELHKNENGSPKFTYESFHGTIFLVATDFFVKPEMYDAAWIN